MRNNFFLSLCYHYLRPERAIDPFPRIIGNSRENFLRQLDFLGESYRIISLDEALEFSFGMNSGLLLTFDDGLADHFWAAQTLAERGLRAVFFIPTCVLEDNLPANPTIIHYCLAVYGLPRFLEICRGGVNELAPDFNEHCLSFAAGDDLWAKIGEVKKIFVHYLKPVLARKILLRIYNDSLTEDYPGIMKIMHLTSEQTREIVAMGHTIGVHSHTHVSAAGVLLSAKEFEKEFVEPKKYLEDSFKVSVKALSYPFGQPEDCFSAAELIKRTGEYQAAFTVTPKANSRETSPLEFGRYMVTGKDDAKSVDRTLTDLIKKEVLG